MKAGASIAVERSGGRDVLVDQRSEAPFSVRQCGDRILLASSAAAPVGGDELELLIAVGAGATATVGSVAASMVWPGPHGDTSSTTTLCTVDTGGHLDLQLEPTISVAGSHHAANTVVRLTGDATCRVVEEIVLGRSDELSGRLDVSLRVERDGVPLAHHGESFGPTVPGALSSVSVGASRFALTAVIVGVDAGEPVAQLDGACSAAWLPVAADAGVALAVGPDRPSTLAHLNALAPHAVTAR